MKTDQNQEIVTTQIFSEIGGLHGQVSRLTFGHAFPSVLNCKPHKALGDPILIFQVRS